MSFVSYAQNFEDVMLWRALQNISSGFYIDVGAHDPNIDSVTRSFYERGWHGINVEPLSACYEKLVVERPADINLCVSAGAVSGCMPFYEIEHSAMSTLSSDVAELHRQNGFNVTTREVQVRTLADICEEYSVEDIHFLKVDVEGAERDVLKGSDFKRFRPRIVLLEATAPNSPMANHHDWESLLVDAGYSFVWFDGLNRFYVPHEHFDDLSRHFKVPPNLFDDFVVARMIRGPAPDSVPSGMIDEGQTRYIVTELYRSLLLREADEQGLAHFSRQLAEGGNISSVASCLITSKEFLDALPRFCRRYHLPTLG